MFALAQSQGWKYIWPVFGATNQLLAALTLIAVTVWLHRAGKKTWYTLFPAVVMLVTTCAALLYYLWYKYLPENNLLLAGTDLVLLALAVGVMILALRHWLSPSQKTSAASA